MIQRIQSVYLLLAAIAIALVFFMPLAQITGNNGLDYIFNYRAIYQITQGKEVIINAAYPIAVAYTIALILSIFTIFRFKNRKLQMKLCITNILIIIIASGLTYFYANQSLSGDNLIVKYKFAAILPLLAIILLFLAYKGIQKDEKLIKSIDRIR